MLPFLALGGGAGAIGWKMREKENRQTRDSAKESKPPAAKDHPEALLRVEPIGDRGRTRPGELSRRRPGIALAAPASPPSRKQLAGDLGYLLAARPRHRQPVAA